MTISPTEMPQAYARAVSLGSDALVVDLVDGRSVSVPIDWFPRLAAGTASERSNWRLIGRGEGIHWPDLDEDISVLSLLQGKSSQESQGSLERWLNGRQIAS
jgi:Protein of unknown function (DUF2442)